MGIFWKNKIQPRAWMALPLLLLGIFAFFVIEAGSFLPSTPASELEAEALKAAGETAPKYYFTKNASVKPKISAEAYVVGDLSTGKIILAKNQNKKYPIASVSKLMTAYVADIYSSTDEVVTISRNALKTEGRNGDFILNEKIKRKDMIYPLLLESSNDAAEALAEHLGRENFLSKMNAAAKHLGLPSTSFDDPSGLSEHNISTAFDLFNFTHYLKNEKPELLNITRNKTYNNGKHNWFNNNQFLAKAGYIGGKSGYIFEAKQTGVSVFSMPLGGDELHPIAITLLQSKDRYKDVETILGYLKNNIYYGEEREANFAWRKAGTNEAEDAEPNSVTFTFLGDIMLDRGVKSSVMKNFGGDYSALFKNLPMLHESDIVFGNLEGTASDQGKDGGSLYSFRMDPGVLPALKGAGVSVLSMANNHSGDWGRDAYTDTLVRLRENEIHYTGGGMTEAEAMEPAIIEKAGMKIGFLGFSDKGPEWMKATFTQAGPLMANHPKFAEIVKSASEKVDYLVVSFHFGEEYKKIHDARQEELAHAAIDNGAKIVVGHHPHVIQDTEVYRHGYIIYSLGNAIFDQGFSGDTMQGLMVHVELNKFGEMAVRKDIVKLNRVFQPETIISGKEEKLKFQPAKEIE